MTLTPSERGSVAAAVWAVLTSALTTEGSIGKLIVDLGARIGAFTGTGVNTILGFFRALMRSDATLPADVGGTFDPTTDALEALRNRGDSGLSAQEVRDALKLAPTVGDPAEGSVDAMLDAIGDSAFDPASDEVNIGSVKGVAVSGVSDFRATGFAVAGDAMTLTPSERGSVAAEVDALLSTEHGDGAWDAVTPAAPTVAEIEAALAAAHGDGAWDAVAPTVAEIEAALATAHGAGSWDAVTDAPTVNEIDAHLSAQHGDGAWNDVAPTPAEIEAALAAAHGAGNWDAVTPPAPTVAEIEAALAAAHGAGAWDAVTDAPTPAEIDTHLSTVHGAGKWDAVTPPAPTVIDIDTQLTTTHGAGAWNVGAELTPEQLDAYLSAQHGAGLWGGAAGAGAYTVTLVLSDGAGRLAGGLAVAIRDLAGNTVAGPLATDTAGRVTYYLDAGDYAVVTPSTIVWLGSSTPLTVTGDAAVDITVGTRSIPLPSAPDKYVIIINAADEFGDLAGAGSWRIRITDVWPRGLPGVDLVQLTRQTPITLDANGQATFEIAKETTAFALAITPRLVAGADGATEIIQVTVDPTVANEYDQIYLADLLTE
jgi:hypothetical protein